VRCSYYAIRRDHEAEREIEPWGLFFERSHWYCVGRARDRAAPRVFRVDRMRGATRLGGTTAAFTVPDDFDVRTYLGRQPWDLSDEPAVRVRVRFGFPQSRWVLNAGRGRAVEPVLDDGGAVIDFDVRERGAFLRWLLTFRRQAVILEPRDVADELEALRARVAALYGG
jgi:proteasome accessory factor B